MFEIDGIKIENCKEGCVTDSDAPRLAFSLKSDKKGAKLENAVVRVGGKEFVTKEQCGIALTGLALCPFAQYEVSVIATDNFGNRADGKTYFCTGRRNTLWTAKWITDLSHKFSKNASPIPFTFRKQFSVGKSVKCAYITATALGIYELQINGQKVGNEYFAPGFTSYKHVLQYNEYDVTSLLENDNTLVAVVGGGWAVGRFTYSSKSKITCDRQAFLAELFIEYQDGTKEKIVTDSSWQVTREGNYRFGDFYDGETYNATTNLDAVKWQFADIYKPKFKVNLSAQYGEKVVESEALTPKESFKAKNGKEIIYDFGQNFAGVVRLKINGISGQKIVIRHAEIMFDGDLCVKSLRTAKATATYICVDGLQEYSPRLTYMGFRYIGISGIDSKDIEVSAVALYSDIKQVGSFECSNELLNKLQSNIVWSGKSNFVDIPTDCPQRDERMGWTGDISVFASTACYNFDMSKFLDKWLYDVRLEQGKGGGIPLVVPKQGISAPTVATACWGDSCIIVPYAEYLARGNIELLKKQYPTMKKFLKAVKFWSGFLSVGKNNRRIWKWLFQFGDWCAPEGGVMDWMKKGKWTATAYYANSCAIMSNVAKLLGYDKDARYYENLRGEICTAYIKKFTDGSGKLKKEFQTGYVLPLYFNMADGQAKQNMAHNLNCLVAENGYRLSTGFTGTPYLLFALADNGYADTAYKVLMQQERPSWLYCVKQGATTTWEEWSIDPTREGNIPSYNHYAYGAVGDFLYRRVLGLEAKEGGYKSFMVKPVLGGGLTYAKGGTMTPYGEINVDWRKSGGQFNITVQVPVSTKCKLVMPSGKEYTLTSGQHSLKEKLL